MKPEKIQYDKNTMKLKFKYVICMCPTPIDLENGKALRIAPIDEPPSSYSFKCDICGLEGVYYG